MIDRRAPTTAHVLENIEAVVELHAKEEGRVGRHQRLVERVTLVLGRPRTVYIILLAVAAWAGANLLATRLALRALDPPPFPWLQGAVGLASLLMTAMVLTTQNRQGRHAEQRLHLDLQVNLMAEQKVAKLIALVEELRRDLPNVRNRTDPVADAMSQAADPRAVIVALEKSLEEIDAGEGGGEPPEGRAPE